MKLKAIAVVICLVLGTAAHAKAEKRKITIVNEAGVPLLMDQGIEYGRCTLQVFVELPPGIEKAEVQQVSYNRDFEEYKVEEAADVNERGEAELHNIWVRDNRLWVRPAEAKIVRVKLGDCVPMSEVNRAMGLE